MSSTDTNVSESTDSSNALNVSGKAGRKKSKNCLSESHVKRNQTSAKKISNFKRNSKELKLFPIFNLPVKNVTTHKMSHHNEHLQTNKILKRASSKVNPIKSDLPIDPVPRRHRKATRKKERTSAKDLSVKNYENSIKSDGCNDQVSDVSLINSKSPLIEIEPAIIETIEYLCSEIKKDVLFDHTPVIDITNYVDRCVIIDKNLSHVFLHNGSNELKLNQKSVQNESKEDKVPVTSVLKDEIVENNFFKTISVENKSMGIETPITSVQKEDIRCVTLENNLSLDNSNNKLKYSKKTEFFFNCNETLPTSVQKDEIISTTLENDLLQVSIKDGNNEMQSSLKKRGKKKSLISKAPFTHIKKDTMTNNTLNIIVKNNLSQDSMENSSNELKSNKKSQQHKSEISPVSVLKDEICTMMENNLSHIQMNDSSSELKSNRKKRGKNKSVSRKTPTSSVLMNDITENVSNRRQSLRSRGIRGNLVNYSEIISPSKIDGKRKRKIHMQNEFDVHPIDIACNTVRQKLTFDTKVVKDHLQEAKAQKRKSKKVKVDLKLFTIFSSTKLKLNESQNKSEKRKAKAIEEVDVKNYDAVEINLRSKRKKTKSNLNIDLLKKCSAKELICSNTKKNCNCIICVTGNSETKTFNESSEGSDICIIEDSGCIRKFDESIKKDSEKSVCLKVINKHKLPDIEVICFPLLSHLKTCSATFSDTSNNYCINEEISDDIVLPVWKGVIGLIDSDCTQMLKSHKKSNAEKTQTIHKFPIIKSLVVENNMLWTDLAQMSVTKGQYNEDTVADIRSWLLQWKNKFSYLEKAGDSESSSSDSDDDFISNGIIISGSPGSGKTSLVFALANELGFTVLEVNASSCRNGRNISNQLKEACESYHVEGVKVENLNKTIFGEINEKKNDKSKESNPADSLKINNTKGIRSFFKAHNTSPKQKDVKSIKTKEMIDNFFHVSDMSEQNLKLKREIKEEIKTVPNKSGKYPEKSNLKNGLNDEPKEKQNMKSKTKAKSSKSEIKSDSIQSENILDTINLKNEKNSCKISSLTIILFDDVDVVFEEDEGFWSTVKGFLKISKKPVIFTVSRNLSVVKAILNSGIQIFNMRPATKEVCVKTLKECCKQYSRENTSIDLKLLTAQNVCDLRRNILNAQFWTQTPKSVEKLDITDKDSVPSFRLVHANGFLTGDLNFSTNYIRKLLFDSTPHNLSNAILQYQSIGYDILFNNLFNILYNLRSPVCERLWQNLTFEIQKCSSSAKKFSDSEMWKEACELFELKKKALKNGSDAQELCIFADALSDFSYADTLKGQSCNKFKWLSVSERVKMWTAGLPICSDLSLGIHEHVLDIISLIHIYRLRKLHKATSLKYSDATDDMQLDLEHSFDHFDESFSYKTEGDLACISSVLPPSQLLNKTALTLDYLSTIKIMCQNEENRQLNTGKRSGRFLHYFDSISLYIDRKTF